MKEIKQTKTRVQKILFRHKAFTLVELIIVITILAILATIAFISFQNFTKDARDTDRVVTLSNIEKALEIHYSKTRSYPNPDGETASGYIIVDGVIEQLTEVGIIGDNLSRILNISKTPIDPISNTNYMYGVSYNKRSFQIAATLESELTNNNFLLNNTYASNPGLKAKVVGTYKYPLKKGNKLYNLPSLLFTGSLGEFTSDTKFIVNNGYNIPYKLNQNNSDNSEDFESTLKKLTKNTPQVLTLTGITIPNINSPDIDRELNNVAYKIGESTETTGIISYGLDNYLTIKDKITIGNISDELLASGTETDIIITDYTAGCTTSDGRTGGNIFEGGDGTSLNPYQIKYDYQVDAIRCNLTANYKLISNVDLVNYLPLASNVYGTEGWLPIGDATNQFEGRLDGNGYTILNIGINRPTTESIGFVGELGSLGIITNLTLKTKDIIGGNRTGGFVGWNEGDISYSNIIINGNINGGEYIGGFAGGMNGDIVNSTANITGSITGTRLLGGFIGWSSGEINNSNLTLNGNVIGSGDKVGGFAGESFIIRNSTANITGNIEAGDDGSESYVGGFIGRVKTDGIVEYGNLSLNGNIIGTLDSIGGFIGGSAGNIDFSNANISGDIKGNNRLGGFIGYLGVNNSSIVNNSIIILDGTIEGKGYYVGGFVGRNHSFGQINNSLSFISGNIILIDGTGWLGGFVGTNDGIISNNYTSKLNISYFDDEGTITGIFNGINWTGATANDYGRQDLTALDFLSKAGFDTNIWGHESGVNGGLPYLK